MKRSAPARLAIHGQVLSAALRVARDTDARRAERVEAARLASWVLQRGHFEEGELASVAAAARACLPEVSVFAPILHGLVRASPRSRLRPVLSRLGAAAHDGGHEGSLRALIARMLRDRSLAVVVEASWRERIATPTAGRWLALARTRSFARRVPTHGMLGGDPDAALQALHAALAECPPGAARVVLARWLVELT
jgi:hypothetical protein